MSNACALNSSKACVDLAAGLVVRIEKNRSWPGKKEHSPDEVQRNPGEVAGLYGNAGRRRRPTPQPFAQNDPRISLCSFRAMALEQVKFREPAARFQSWPPSHSKSPANNGSMSTVVALKRDSPPVTVVEPITKPPGTTTIA